MPPRQHNDPFADAPLRPASLNPSLHGQAPPAPSRTRQRRDVFAPSYLRRPTSRTTLRTENVVLADPDTDVESGVPQHRRPRKARQGSPEGKHSRLKARNEEEVDIVNRRSDGEYLLGPSNEIVSAVMWAREIREAKAMEELDAEYAGKARSYFTSGAAMKNTKKQDEEHQIIALPMMQRLREQALQKIEDERWLFEPLDPLQSRLP